jgi:hypothetical protein
VLAAEHLLGLGRLDFLLQRVERPLEIAGDILAGLRPLDEHADVVDLAGEMVAKLEVVAQPATALEYSLRLGLVAPEVGFGDLLLDAGEFLRIVGGVKDSSACRRPA